MSSRDEVLARIRAALGAESVESTVPRTYRSRGEHARGESTLIDLLAERLEDYRAHVWRSSSEAVPATVSRALVHGLPHAQPGSAPHARPRILMPPGLPGEWVSDAEVDLVTDEHLDAAVLDTCDGVITAAAVAIAETGTIVLDGTADQGRRAITLVPDLHVCVVRADQVVATVPEGVAGLDPTRPLTWISGPSATSDIELDRVEGVHGPRTLEVVLVEG